MKKRAFLAPLALSVAALVGTLSIGQRALADPIIPNQLGTSASAAAIPGAGQFVITPSSAVGGGFADHESHYSHESHSSHESHASHSSHYSSS